MGSRLCSIPNAQRYCIALLRVACLDTSEPSKDGTPLLHDRQAAMGQLDLKAPLSAMDAVAMDAVAMDNSDDCLNGSDMETSGYEGDTDGGEESSDSCKQLDDSRMLQSVTQYLVPKDIRKPVKLWVPVLYCVELVRECVDKMEENWWVHYPSPHTPLLSTSSPFFHPSFPPPLSLPLPLLPFPSSPPLLLFPFLLCIDVRLSSAVNSVFR